VSYLFASLTDTGEKKYIAVVTVQHLSYDLKYQSLSATQHIYIKKKVSESNELEYLYAKI